MTFAVQRSNAGRMHQVSDLRELHIHLFRSYVLQFAIREEKINHIFNAHVIDDFFVMKMR
jgi:hypothetical protein